MSSFVGSRRRESETERWHVIIPRNLAFRFDTLHMDPSRHKPIFGARSQIITELLEQYVAAAEASLAAKAAELNGEAA